MSFRMSLSAVGFGACLLVAALSGCHSTAATHGTQPGPVGASSNGTGMSQADMAEMCRGMHGKIAAANSADERRAVMHEHMKSMPPEMQQRMHQHMKSLSPEMRQQMHERMETMCQ